MRDTTKDENNITIDVDNFEIISRKYKPLLTKVASEVMKMYGYDARLDFEELMQEANIGLWKAIKGFDPTRNIFFGVYARQAIQNHTKCFVRDYLPHRYEKHDEWTREHPKFKRIQIFTTYLSDKAEEAVVNHQDW